MIGDLEVLGDFSVVVFSNGVRVRSSHNFEVVIEASVTYCVDILATIFILRSGIWLLTFTIRRRA